MDAAPTSWKPYLKLIRWDRPIGSWLLFLPCTWSICLAADSLNQIPSVSTLALFGMGAVVMRGAGCTINDMWDRDYDKKVERTKDRPIACGDISQKQALAFLAAQLSTGLAILLSFDWTTVMLGASSMVFIITYPLMKRITYWPQLFLGVVFNWGAMLGWSASTGGLVEWSSVMPLYSAAIMWTLTYDTIYGHQDKEDDQLIGVKSTALRFGDNSKIWLSAFSTIMSGGLLTTGVLCDQAWPYFAGVGFVGSHLMYQLYTVNLNSAEDCSKTFRSNKNLGIILWIAILLSSAVKYDRRKKQEKLDGISSS